MRYRFTENLLNELKLPYNDGCVNFITNTLEEKYNEQLNKIEVKKEDIITCWMSYVEYLMNSK